MYMYHTLPMVYLIFLINIYTYTITLLFNVGYIEVTHTHTHFSSYGPHVQFTWECTLLERFTSFKADHRSPNSTPSMSRQRIKGTLGKGRFFNDIHINHKSQKVG